MDEQFVLQSPELRKQSSTAWYIIQHLLSVKSINSELTCFIFILNVIGGNDTVSIKPLGPPEVHAAIFNFSYL